MSLTGPGLAWATAAVAVFAFVTVVALWPALGRRRTTALAVLARTGVLAFVNVLVLLTVAVQLNDQFLFFAGWPDLAGALGGTTTSSSLHGGGAAPLSAADPVGGAVAVTVATPQPLPAGEKIQDGVIAYRVTGRLSGLTGQILISTPPGYDPTSTRRYPVLETFSGYPGATTQWVKTMHLRGVLADQVAGHHLGPALLVSPQLEIPAGVDTECVNGSAGRPQVETWLARDVPDWVAAHFRVVGQRTGWATIGLSAGGWCAAMVTMLHPAQYGAAVVLGGYFHPDFGAGYEPYPAGSPLARRYDLVTLAKRSPPPVALWIETSHADPLSYGTSAALIKAAAAPLSITATVLHDAGHRIGVWRDLTPAALTWLGGAVPGFRPS